MRQENSLHSLTPAQQEQLFDWLELYPAKTGLEPLYVIYGYPPLSAPNPDKHKIDRGGPGNLRERLPR